MTDASARAVIAFWREAGAGRWFKADPAFDAAIRARFGMLHEEAAQGALASWEATAEGALALVLLLDQFSRNLFRGDARAFAQDEAARAIAERAIARGFDKAFPVPERRFFYLPFMHAEDMAAQERCIALCRAAGDPEGVRYAEAHRDIIARFGRFPNRNAALGRATSGAEQAFLDSGGGF